MQRRIIKALSDLMDGEVERRFNEELNKVWENVCDTGTEPTQKREVTLKIKIVPNIDRDKCEFEVTTNAKLVPRVALHQYIKLERKMDGSVIATEETDQLPGQIGFDDEYTVPMERVWTGREAIMEDEDDQDMGTD